MHTAKTAEGSSSKGQENGDASNECERPLKKARFAWQVKGKYHLKNDANDTARTSTALTSEPDVAESSGSGSNNSGTIKNNNIGSEQNLHILGNYLIQEDSNTLETVYVSPEAGLTPNTSISLENLPYPRYVSTYEQNMSSNGLKPSENSTDTNNLPVSLIAMEKFTEDQCIARWQTKQIIKGFVDNTINRVLDLWIQAPLPPEDDRSRSVALDVAEFINNLPGDNSIENEGILMAISAHGLQHPAGSSSNNDTDDHNQNSDTHNDPDNFQSLTPLPSDDESHEPVNNQCDIDTSSNDLDMPWSYDDQKDESNDTIPFPLFPDASSLSYQGANDSHQNSSGECDAINNTVDNHCAFLDEAILFAIQSKGLTPFGSDYG